MSYYYEIMKSLISSLIYVFVFFVIIDIAVSYTAKHRGLALKNKYYNLNLKHGFFKVTSLKIGAALILSYFLIDPAPNVAGLILAVLTYALIVIKLLVDFIK